MTRKLLALLLALIMMTSSALAWGEKDAAAEQYAAALSLLQEGKHAEAGAMFAGMGNYEEANRLAMYCLAISCGESGNYALAVNNLNTLGGFRDSAILAVYYNALYYEALQEYEKAMELFNGMELYLDVADRLSAYPEKINARDYAVADLAEQQNKLEKALEGFLALGSYKDSPARAAAVQEKINARDYAAADKAEQDGKLEEALEGFLALGSYSDSPARAEAVKTKIAERDAAAAEAARAAAYAAADKAEQDGDFAAAYEGFVSLGDYKDSAARASAVQDKGNYAKGLQLAKNGRFAEAYKTFADLGDYEDSAEKAYVLGVTDFAKITDKGNGVAAFQFHEAWGVINVNENIASSPYWDEIGKFNQFGLARVAKGESFGYINTRGEVVIPCEWYDVSDFSEDGFCTVARFKKTGRGWDAKEYYYFGIMNHEGDVILNDEWRMIGNARNDDWANRYNYCRNAAPAFSDGKIRVQTAEGLYGFMDAEGNQVGEIRWASIADFSEGLAVVQENGKFGYIDANGQVVIEPQYDGAMQFSEGLAAVKIGHRWKYINSSNNEVIARMFSEVTNFKNGTADVLLPGTGWMVIDKTGELLYFKNDDTIAAYEAAKNPPEAPAEPAAMSESEALYAIFAQVLESYGYEYNEELALELAAGNNVYEMIAAGNYAEAAAIIAELYGVKIDI